MIKQILLIDDDPIINFIHSKIIQRKFPDTAILIFENGHKGLMHIKNNPTNSYLIFLDLNMPEMNGWEFLSAISLEFAEVTLQIHIVTSSIDPEDRKESKNYKQILSFLTKPLKAEKLETIVFDYSSKDEK